MTKIQLQENQKLFFSSDLHFFHKAILDFCPNRIKKYGSTVPEMNENIVKDWNETVNSEDIVFILGDVSFGSITDTAEILSRLNGQLHLISGNHDQRYLDKKLFTVWFKSIQPYLEIQVNQQKIIMSHFPFAEWNACHWGSWHLFGHLHGNESELIKQLKKIQMHGYIESYAKARNLTYNSVFESQISVAKLQMNKDLLYFLMGDCNVIWDQTNLTKKSRKNKLKEFEDYEKYCFFFDTPFETILERNEKRRLTGRNIPTRILFQMKEHLEVPTTDEGFDYVYTIKGE